MGVAFGFMFGALERPLHVENMKTREVLLHGVRTMGSKGYHLGKSFAVMGAIFSGAECVVEKVRSVGLGPSCAIYFRTMSSHIQCHARFFLPGSSQARHLQLPRSRMRHWWCHISIRGPPSCMCRVCGIRRLLSCH